MPNSSEATARIFFAIPSSLYDISLTVLPAYPPVFHMPADLFFHILKPLIPLRKRSALLRIGGSIKTDHTDFLQHHRQQIQKD